MSSPAQTPVQIARVAPGLDATETALTGLLGATTRVGRRTVPVGPGLGSAHGEPADSVAGGAPGNLGDRPRELIRPIRGQSTPSEVLRECGPRGPQIRGFGDDINQQQCRVGETARGDQQEGRP